MCAGPLLAELAQEPGLRERLRRVTEVPVPSATTATMFAASLAVWGDDAVTDGLCTRAELTYLEAELAAILEGSVTGEITWGLHQAVYVAAE